MSVADLIKVIAIIGDRLLKRATITPTIREVNFADCASEGVVIVTDEVGGGYFFMRGVSTCEGIGDAILSVLIGVRKPILEVRDLCGVSRKNSIGYSPIIV